MVAHLPMFKVVFPANAQMILEPLVEVANFDLIPVWLFYPFIFNFGDSDPYNQNFQFTGYDSGYLAENMGTTFVLSHLAVVGLLIAGFMKFSIKRAAQRQSDSTKYINKYIFLCYRPYFKLRHWLSWAVLIRLMLEFYLEMILCSTVILVTWNWTDDPNDQMNCVYGVIYFIFTISFPLLMFAFYRKNRDRLYQSRFRQKYGGGYEGLKTPTSLDREVPLRKRAYIATLITPTIFVGRRIIFAFSVIFYSTEGGATLLPILVSFWTVWISLEFLISTFPYERNKNTYMEIFNEITLLLLMCFLLGFTAWMPVIELDSSVIKFVLGWIFVAIVFTNIIVHFIVMILETFKVSCNFTVKTVKKVQHKREMERRATLQAEELAALLASIKEVEEEQLPSVGKEPEPESVDSFEPVQRIEYTLEAPEIINMKKEPMTDISKLDTFK